MLGYWQCKYRKNSFGDALGFWNINGSFVWGDVVVFSLFWSLVSVVILGIQDWVLFWLMQAVFWVIRSLGEVIYWFSQQFSSKQLEDPKKFWFYSIFQNHSVWFVNQIFWQCVAVVAVVMSLWLGKVWLSS